MRKGWRITQVLNTHWHPDHTGGNQGIKAATGCAITAPAEAERVSKIDRIVAEGDRVTVAGAEAIVWDIPAHTAGHIAYYFEDEGMIFVGDTMFAMGCGRLFEGTAEQMYRQHAADRRACPTTSASIAATNIRSRTRASRTRRPGQCRGRASGWNGSWPCATEGEITLPTTVAEERATNPFVRARMPRNSRACVRRKTASVKLHRALYGTHKLERRSCHARYPAPSRRRRIDRLHDAAAARDPQRRSRRPNSRSSPPARSPGSR